MPDVVALREKDFGIWQEITWSEYWENILEVAHGLLALGVERHGAGDGQAAEAQARRQILGEA